MTNQNSHTKYISKCCNAEVMGTHGNCKPNCNCALTVATTWFYSCATCRKPCDIFESPSPKLFETATPEQKKELIRECVREANQDQRDTYELEKLIKEAEKKFRY